MKDASTTNKKPAAGWASLTAAMATARDSILAAAPDAETALEGEAYLTRVLTGILADSFLGHLSGGNGLLRAMPTKGGPNPDYLMSHAPIATAHRYQLTGRLNGSERIGIGLYSFSPEGVALERGYRVFNPGNVDTDGGFSLEISAAPQTPAGLTIQPDCRVLLIRVLHRDTARQPAALHLSGGAITPNLALPAGGNDAGLMLAGQMTLRNVTQFINWSAVCSAHANQLFTPPDAMAAAVQGDPGTRYLLGYYHLDEGQWLEVELPENPGGYWSLHAYNHWGEYLPGATIHDRNGVTAPNGSVVITVGPALPNGTSNRIDTLGRRRGMLVFRSIAADDSAPADSSILPITRLRSE